MIHLPVTSHPPGPCPFLANSTRCSGVKSRNFFAGSGGASRTSPFSIWAVSVWPAALSNAAPVLVLSAVVLRHVFRPNHNPPAASNTAIAKKRCFLFIIFPCAAKCDTDPRRCLAIWNEAASFGCETPKTRNEPMKKISASTGIPAFAGFRESAEWWDSSCRFSAPRGSPRGTSAAAPGPGQGLQSRSG